MLQTQLLVEMSFTVWHPVAARSAWHLHQTGALVSCSSKQHSLQSNVRCLVMTADELPAFPGMKTHLGVSSEVQELLAGIDNEPLQAEI